MNEPKMIARVILRSDGNVYICFEGPRAICATPETIMELVSDPIFFIEDGSNVYEDVTLQINRKRLPLTQITGLTLCTVNSDKQIMCDFPELFQFVFDGCQFEEQKSIPLNMKVFEEKTVFSDEKAYLLRYYLEFTSNLAALPMIKKNIKLREKVQFAIIQEILAAFWNEELPKASKITDLATQIKEVETDQVFQKDKPGTENNMVGKNKYAEIYDLAPQTVQNYLKKNLFKTAIKNEVGHWRIDKTEHPPKWDIRQGKKRKETKRGEKCYRRTKAGSAADVEEHILKLDLFKPPVSSYIHSFEELDYYTTRYYRQVCWDGRHALIVDVNPEYKHSKTGKSNLELMKEGKPPHYAKQEWEDAVWDLHHLAMRKTAPLACIPSFDHNSKQYSKYFHQGSPEPDIHGREWEVQKANFWRKYAEEYEKADGYRNIKYENNRRAKNKR